MRKLTAVMFIIIPYFLNAQNESTNYFVDKFNTSSSSSRIEVKPNKDTVLISSYITQNSKNSTRNEFEIVYKGTPYFQNGWYRSEIFFNEGFKPIIGTIAYNLINQKIMYALSNTTEARESSPNSFIINGNHFFKLNDYYTNAGNYYYQKIYIGKYQIFKANLCVYSQLRNIEKTGYESESSEFEGEFSKFTKYYVAENDELRFINNIKKYFKSKGISKKELETLIDVNKVDLKSDLAIITLFKYLEKLE